MSGTAPFATVDGLALPTTAFIHIPRPPGVPGMDTSVRQYLHYVGDRVTDNCLHAGTPANTFPLLTLSRRLGNTKVALGLLTLDATMKINLHASTLRELARMCIDAAHDVETNP
jgi:hypothetical protein